MDQADECLGASIVGASHDLKLQALGLLTPPVAVVGRQDGDLPEPVAWLENDECRQLVVVPRSEPLDVPAGEFLRRPLSNLLFNLEGVLLAGGRARKPPQLGTMLGSDGPKVQARWRSVVRVETVEGSFGDPAEVGCNRWNEGTERLGVA